MEAGPQYFGEYLAALVVDAVRQAQSIQSTIEQQQRESYQLYQSAMVSVGFVRMSGLQHDLVGRCLIM